MWILDLLTLYPTRGLIIAVVITAVLAVAGFAIVKKAGIIVLYCFSGYFLTYLSADFFADPWAKTTARLYDAGAEKVEMVFFPASISQWTRLHRSLPRKIMRRASI